MSRLYEAVCEAIDNQYYHADENKYSIGDNIIKDYSRGNEYKVDLDIAEVYSRKTVKILYILYTCLTILMKNIKVIIIFMRSKQKIL